MKHRCDKRGARRRRLHACCWALLLWAGTAHTDPLAEFRRACEAPYMDQLLAIPHPTSYETTGMVEAALRALEETCTPFYERLSSTASRTPHESLALLKAKQWVVRGGTAEEHCADARTVQESLPRHPEVLYELAVWCEMSPEADMALLRESLAASPRNLNALKSLHFRLSYRGGDGGMDPVELSRHRETLYEVSRLYDDKLAAAVWIHEAAVKVGDLAAAAAVRTRVRGDLELDDLDFGPERREGSLRRVCGAPILDLDLEYLCTGAAAKLAAESAASGIALAPDILRPLESTVRLIADTRLQSIGGGGPEERVALSKLRALLNGYPEPLKSAEHQRVYAETFLDGPERTTDLRKAVALDPGNLAARCSLAESLEHSSPQEALSIYAALAAEPADSLWPCDPNASLQMLDQQVRSGATGDNDARAPGEEVFVVH